MVRKAMLRRNGAFALGLGLLAMTGGCSGGDGPTPAPTPTPTNRAPAFTSAATVSVSENKAGAVYTATATDADGDPVTFSISGGTDAGAFTLASGVLTLVSAANFDRPTDANADNVYNVTLTAADAKGGSTALALNVQITNDHEGVNLVRVAAGFGADAVIAPLSRKTGLIAISQDGTARLVDAASGALTTITNVFKPGENGRVLAVAEFNTFGVAMLDIDGVGVILRTILLSDSRAQFVLEDDVAGPSTMKPRGTLFVGGDGFLYGALGDPSGNFAKDSEAGHGKFYRVEIDPYCGASFLTYCMYAEQSGDGVHAPAGGGGYAGKSFLLDRGTDKQEEVNFFDQRAEPDFGWPFREGTIERVANPPAVGIVPSLIYPHGTGFFAGSGLTGGMLYGGSIASIDGRVLLTDEAGRIFAFPATLLGDGAVHQASEMENRTADFAPASGAIERPVAILRDFAGRLFVLDGDGELYGTS
ncbi:cadherin repeat domain-containing protein [Sphingomonas sp. HF-S3]|uniref:Cadherin repeat domain-containing protein n=1 Tax=Sphingomonas rustica TaxID=3103142 RepID=A0ABV0B569_9SPHN